MPKGSTLRSQAANHALQPKANPLRGLSAAELGRYVSGGRPTDMGNPVTVPTGRIQKKTVKDAPMIEGRRKVIAALVAGVIGIGGTAIQKAKAQGTGNSELVGRWLDVAGTHWRVIFEIHANESIRTFTVARHFTDGSVVERAAVEVVPQGNEKRRWRDVEGAHGSELALYPDGSLGLFDNEGFIRRAQPMRRE